MKTLIEIMLLWLLLGGVIGYLFGTMARMGEKR